MNTSNRAWRTVQLALAAAGCVMAGDMSLAQQSTRSEVVIQAGRPVTKVIGLTPHGAPIEETTITRKVSYADLDLASTAGVTELEKRVNETAKDVCRQLDKLYPTTASQSPDCVKKASSQGMEQVRVAIAAASSKATAR